MKKVIAITIMLAFALTTISFGFGLAEAKNTTITIVEPGSFVFIADKDGVGKAHVIEFHRFGQGASIVGKEANSRILAIVGPDDELDLEEIEVLSFTQYKNLFRKADLAKLIQKLDDGKPIGFLNSVTHYSKAVGSVLKDQGESAAEWLSRWLDKNK